MGGRISVRKKVNKIISFLKEMRFTVQNRENDVILVSKDKRVMVKILRLGLKRKSLGE